MSETGLVGPATVCRDEANSAATTVGTIAQYRPYSGGSPASVANATPCGSTTMAPINPASASAFSAERSTRGHHLSKGSRRCGSGMVETAEGVTREDRNPYSIKRGLPAAPVISCDAFPSSDAH